MINGHGDDSYNFTKKIGSNFSSNIYSRQDLSALKAHLCSQMDLIQSYPEPDAHSLVTLLGQEYGINLNNICVTNGATEAIYLIAQAFGGSCSGILIPTFSEYEDACRIHKHTLSFFENIDTIDLLSELIWIGNPNNPNGKTYDLDYLKEKVSRNKGAIFVFDQSYGYFTEKDVWNIREAVAYENVILLHSMTKQYAVPGLRLGYITAHASLIERIEEKRMPWSVNGLAVEAGKFLIEKKKNKLDVREYLQETKRLQEALKKLDGLIVYPTDTHFFLCRLQNRKGFELKSYLIDQYGILIRDASNFRGLEEDCIRIATQSPEENNQLVKAIAKWI